MITERPGLKVLRRRVLIKASDFPKLRRNALSKNFDKGGLYDTATFLPVNQHELGKEYTLKALTGKVDVPEKYYTNLHRYLKVLETYLYNKNYLNYKIVLDDNGFVYLQYRKNTEPSILGWAILEKKFYKNENRNNRDS